MSKKKKHAHKNHNNNYNTVQKLAEQKQENKNIVLVKNAEGDPDTTAEIVIQNKIDYEPKVSVIIPVYNVEEYLRECLDSVVNQTLKEIEIICVDDGSTDSSLEILKEYAQKDNRITVMKQANLYAGVARNAGLAVAKGEYLSFLDSDDFFELNMLEEMSQKADDDGSDIVICQCNTVDEKGIFNPDKLNYSLRLDILRDKSIFSVLDIPTKIFQVCQGFAWDKLFSHEFVKKENLKFQNLLNTNDAQFTFSALCFASSISYIQKRFAIKRHMHAKSLTATRKKDPDCFILAIEKIKSNLERKKIFNLVKNSFWEWAISLCLIQLKVLDQESKNKLYVSLHKKFSEWGEQIDSSKPDTNRYRAIHWIKTQSVFPTINIAYATNKPFMDLCLTSILSILKTKTYENINILLLHSELTEDDLRPLEELRKEFSFSYSTFKVNDDLFNNFPLVWTSKETWYRCILATEFPCYDKVLYLDCDTIVRKSLLPLWEIEMGDNLIAAVEDVSLSKDNACKINLKDNFFFNAGVLLLNTKEWREQKFLEQIEKYVKNNECFQADQGTLNILSDMKKIRISPEFNFMEVWWRKNVCQYDDEYIKLYNKKNPTIVHFTGPKPIKVNCGNSYRNEFLKYYSMLPNYKAIKKIKKIPVILSSDNNYAPYMYVTMLSILMNSDKNSFYMFYLLVPETFSEKNKKIINQLKDYENCKINFINMKNLFSELKMNISHITSPTYYRLLMADLLPKQLDKCIYLDTDVIVEKDLKEFFNIDITDYYIAGVQAFAYINNLKNRKYYSEIGLKKLDNYINAGVTLWNLKKIRNDNLTPKMLDMVKNNYKSQDQDVINILFQDKIKILPFKFNMMTKYKREIVEKNNNFYKLYGKKNIEEVLKNPYIIHYADKIKPWVDKSSYFSEYWWKYSKHSPYFKYKFKPYLLFPVYLIKSVRAKKKMHKMICRIIRGKLANQFDNTFALTKQQITDFALKNNPSPEYVKKNIKRIKNDIYDKFHFRKKHRILGIKFYTKNKHKELVSLLNYTIKKLEKLKNK